MTSLQSIATEGKDMSMSPVVVAPGLVLDETLYEVAAEGVLHHTPDRAPLTWETFTSPRRWWIIPDTDCLGYRAELTLHADRARTIRLNRWYRPTHRHNRTSSGKAVRVLCCHGRVGLHGYRCAGGGLSGERKCL